MSNGDGTAPEDIYDPTKVQILPGAQHDAMTFAIHEEDHTLGNSLRYIIMKNPKVEFCGYSAPHPTEHKIHLRIQMFDNESAAEALLKGLDDLESLTQTVNAKYEEALARKDYPVVVEPTVEQRLEELKRAKYPHLLGSATGDVMVE